MTNKQVIELNTVLSNLSSLYFGDTNNKVKFTDGFRYAMNKNIRKSAKVIDEFDEVKKQVLELWKKTVKFDDKNTDEQYIKEQNSAYKEYLAANPNEFDNFLNDESDFVIHKISESDFDGCEMHKDFIGYLGKIIVKDAE